jgi:hypothetical protein
MTRGEHHGIYRRSKAVLWLKIGHVGRTCQASWPCNLAGRPSFSLHRHWALDTLSTTSAEHVDKMVFGNAPTHGWSAKVMWPAGHSLTRLSPCFVPHHFLVSLSMTMPYFGHNVDMHALCSMWCFSVIRCS